MRQNLSTYVGEEGKHIERAQDKYDAQRKRCEKAHHEKINSDEKEGNLVDSDEKHTRILNLLGLLGASKTKIAERQDEYDKAERTIDEEEARKGMCTHHDLCSFCTVFKEEERLREIEQKKYLQSRECVNPNCTK